MTCRNGVWYGYDLTHPFLDDRSTVVRGQSVNSSIEQEATLRIPIANVVMPQPLPPAHLVLQPRLQAPPQPQPPLLLLPTVQSLAPSSTHLASYASAPAAQAPPMILSSTYQQELECSSPMSSCLTTTREPVPSTSAATTRALSPVSDEELRCKPASPHELSVTAGTNDSPTSRPPPDKRHGVLRSVVIQEPPRVGYRGTPEPQMAMNEVLERYAPSSSSVVEGTDGSMQSSSSSVAKPAKTVRAHYPLSEKMSGSVVTRDANRIWQMAPRLNG